MLKFVFVRLLYMYSFSLPHQTSFSQLYKWRFDEGNITDLGSRGIVLCIYVVKTKVLISCAVTAQLICTFVFAYAKSRFSHDTAHIVCSIIKYPHLVYCLVIHVHFSLLASGSDDVQVILWDPFRKKKVTNIRTGHQGNIFSIKVRQYEA